MSNFDKLFITPMDELNNDEIREKWMLTKPAGETLIMVFMLIVCSIVNLFTVSTGARWHSVIALLILGILLLARNWHLQRRASQMSRQEMIDEINRLEEIRRESPL